MSFKSVPAMVLKMPFNNQFINWWPEILPT